MHDLIKSAKYSNLSAFLCCSGQLKNRPNLSTFHDYKQLHDHSNKYSLFQSTL